MGKHLKLKIGDVVMKCNFDLFRDHPLLKIEKILPWSQECYQLNGVFVIFQENVKVLNAEEIEEIEKVWKSCQEVSEVIRPNEYGTCVREDNGKPKIKYRRDNFQAKLFLWKMRNPGGLFTAYECPGCREIHIGKTSHLV